MNKLDKDYQALLQDILDNGVTKSDRTGTGTISVFGRQIRHKMKDGFPLLTTKKMAWKTLVTELIWFLNGDTNIKFLVDNGCHIWDGDAYKAYLSYPLATIQDYRTNILYQNIDKGWCIRNGRSIVSPHPTRHLTKEEFINKIKTDDEFAKKWGDLGPVYGKQWRKWKGKLVDKSEELNAHTAWIPEQIDQIANLINDLKTNPDSRRLMVSAWNVGELDQMTLPPCHYGFQVYTRELSFEERKEILYNKFRKGPIIVNGESYVECAPTNINFEFFNIPTRAISLMWNQRSVDTFLGLPFNIASYGLLLEIIAKAVNMIPDELIGNLGDVHLYSNHIEQAKEQIGREMTWEEQVQWVMKNTDVEMENLHITEEVFKDTTPKHTREPYPLPTLNINTEFWQTESGECGVGLLATNLLGLEISDFTLENYQSHPTIKAPLSN
jgi:thymidylate synthase